MSANRTRTLIAAAAAAAIVAAAVPAGASAAKGTMKGSVAVAPAGTQFQSSVRAYRLTPGLVAVRVPLSAAGTYSVRVAPGLYGLVLTGWVKGQSKTVTRLVRVRSGLTTRVKRLASVAQLNATTIPPIRLSVGRIRPTDPSLAYLKNALADLAISDMPGSFGKCKMGIYEDRKYGRFQDILNEIALGKSRYADAEFRAMALQAERNLKLHTPTVRLNGTVDTVSDTGAAGNFQLVNIKTGKTMWSARVSAGHIFDLPGVALGLAIKRLCNPSVFPLTYKGNVTVNQAFGPLTEDWAGTFTYKRVNQQTNPDGSRNALYDLIGASVSTFQQSGVCTASTSSTSPTIRFGDLEIDVSPSGVWTYGFVVDTELPTATHVCPPAGASSFTPTTVFNSRSVTTNLAPMPKRGTIAGSGSITITPGSASWSLAPGD